MRVALLHPLFWPEVRRGAERFTRELADGLLARGHHPRLITSHPGPARRDVEDGLEIVRNHRPSQRLLLRLGFEAYLTHLPGTSRELSAGDDDLVHTLHPNDALVAARWARKTGRPAVYSHMGTPEPAYLSGARLRFPIFRRAVAGADVTVALSHAAAAGFLQVLGEDVLVIHPGVDLERFTLGPGTRAEAPTIVSAAALDAPHKRIELLIEAFRLVRREHPAARLVLDRPRDPAARPPAIEGVGVVAMDDHAALLEAYRSAWVCALPSVNEAFGLVLVEAMACGTPAVASASGGMPEILEGHPEVGRLFAGDDPGALARALLEAFELASDPATPEACRARAAYFSSDLTAQRYERLYTVLLEVPHAERRARAGALRDELS